MPLQHIDDNLLKSMRRQTSEQSVRQLLDLLRSKLAPLTLRTTMIVGFPGESEAAFEKLYNFIKEQRFDRLGVFTYSREPGTPAAEMPGQIPEKIKKQRRDAIMKLQQQISLENHRVQVGKILPALVESQMTEKIDSSKGKYAYYARLQSQAPDVDGRTMIYTDRPLKISQIHSVKIEAASHYDLFAIPV
jgi:ribosomal protein S12 methylthiotransferase